jgi:tRNA(Met) C34 N-acetyltransferase TmcA
MSSRGSSTNGAFEVFGPNVEKTAPTVGAALSLAQGKAARSDAPAIGTWRVTHGEHGLVYEVSKDRNGTIWTTPVASSEKLAAAEIVTLDEAAGVEVSLVEEVEEAA